MADERFSRDYCKRLAEALQEKESQEVRIPKDQLSLDAYVALCYDDPRVESDEGCFALAASLLSDAGDLALSERLVEGIRQACSRLTPTTKSSEQKQQQEDSAVLDESYVLQKGGTASAAGYAVLAAAAFVEIPLNCCQSANKKSVQKLLGSYRGPVIVEQDEQEQPQPPQQAESSPIPTTTTTTTNDNEDKNDDMDPEEVWAEESDPSDFEYESGCNYQQAVDWSAWESTSFEPKTLSKPMDGDWDELRGAVGNLLRELSYSKLSVLGKFQWKKIETNLIQLTTALLVGNTNPMLENLREQSMQPLNTLLDRAMQYPKESLTPYIGLLTSLITAKDPNPTINELSLTSIVGITSLSSLCVYAKKMNQVASVRRSVFDLSEDLGALLDQSQQHSSDNPNNPPTWVRMVSALLPMMELISNIHNEDGTAVESSSLAAMTPADGQRLLNSGLFRELILLYTRTNDQDGGSMALSFARNRLMRSIQMVCLQSLSLLGKYAWRVPDLSRIIHKPEFHEAHVVDGLLWSLMGVELTGNSAGVLRYKKAGNATPTTQMCQESVHRSLEQLCHQVVCCLEDNIITMNKKQPREESNNNHSWNEPILELARFTNCLISCGKSLSPLWKKTVTREVLDPIRSSLREALSKVPAVVEKAPEKKDGDNDKVEALSLERPAPTHHEEIAMVRKSIKVLSLSLQESENTPFLSSKTD